MDNPYSHCQKCHSDIIYTDRYDAANFILYHCDDCGFEHLDPTPRRDSFGRYRFPVPQRYSVPVNDTTDKSVTITMLHVEANQLCDKFYHSFRRWLKAMGVPIVQYLYEANFHEVLCGNLPEVKSQRLELDSLRTKGLSVRSADAVSDQAPEVAPA